MHHGAKGIEGQEWRTASDHRGPKGLPRPGTDAMPMALSNRNGPEPRMMTLEGNTAILLRA
ncbi:hypothetical protein Trisim1_004361 [Trichoderma cf. simile WF8]